MPILKALEITNYRSVEGPLRIEFPRNGPLVLIGENNAGKSNIVRALDMVLGEAWTGNRDPEDHEFFGRDRNLEIEIRAIFDAGQPLADRYTEAIWTFNIDTVGEAAHHVYPSRYEKRRTDYMSNAIKSTCVCVVIEADRNLNYHLGYATRWTLLSKLMHAFHKSLLADAETKEQLESLFQEVKRQFESVQPYAEFVSTLKDQLRGLTGSMTHRLEVDFQAYNPVNFFHALRLHAVEGDSPRTLSELGTGEQQVLALSFAYAYATTFHEGIILVIEEPEAHLHPLAQRWLGRHIRELTAGGLQIILTTHSPHFLDIERLEGLVLVRRTTGGTTAVQLDAAALAEHCIRLGAPPARIESSTILPFYASVATPEVLEGFFAKLVVLVEGPTEALALPVLLERCGVLTSSEGIAVVPVGGKGNLAKWRRLFSAYSVPTYLVFDHDGRQDDREGAKRRDALRSIGLDQESHAAHLIEEGWIVGAELMVFGRNFEDELSANFARYQDLSDNASAHGIDSKPFRAKWIANRLPEGDDQGWVRVREFAAALRALLPAQRPERDVQAGTATSRQEGLSRPAARPGRGQT